MHFTVVRRVNHYSRALAKEMLCDEVHRAISGIPILYVLIGVWDDSLPNAIDFEMNEAESALKVGANYRFTGAGRATEDNEHVVILQPELLLQCPAEERRRVQLELKE